MRESSQIRLSLDELRCKEEGEERVIAFNVSGLGFLDLKAYEGKLNL